MEHTCPFCKTPVNESAKFCPQCGKNIGEQICPNCNKVCAPGAKFCDGCGKELMPDVSKQSGSQTKENIEKLQGIAKEAFKNVDSYIKNQDLLSDENKTKAKSFVAQILPSLLGTLKKSFNISGSATVFDFCCFFAFNMICSFLAALAFEHYAAALIVQILLLCPFLTLATRRLNDANISKSIIKLNLCFYISIAIMIILAINDVKLPEVPFTKYIIYAWIVFGMTIHAILVSLCCIESRESIHNKYYLNSKLLSNIWKNILNCVKSTSDFKGESGRFEFYSYAYFFYALLMTFYLYMGFSFKSPGIFFPVLIIASIPLVALFIRRLRNASLHPLICIIPIGALFIYYILVYNIDFNALADYYSFRKYKGSVDPWNIAADNLQKSNHFAVICAGIYVLFLMLCSKVGKKIKQENISGEECKINDSNKEQ